MSPGAPSPIFSISRAVKNKWLALSEQQHIKVVPKDNANLCQSPIETVQDIPYVIRALHVDMPLPVHAFVSRHPPLCETYRDMKKLSNLDGSIGMWDWVCYLQLTTHSSSRTTSTSTSTSTKFSFQTLAYNSVPHLHMQYSLIYDALLMGRIPKTTQRRTTNTAKSSGLHSSKQHKVLLR